MWFSSLRKKVISELFLAPSVILPIVAGASAWLLSWASGGIETLTVAGLVAILAGVGWLGTRVIFFMDQVVEKVSAEEKAKIVQAQEERIAKVLKKLHYDRDPRTEDYLAMLKMARADFQKISEDESMVIKTLEIRSQFNMLFWAAIDQLERSYEAFEQSERIFGNERSDILAKREKILLEVKATAEQLRNVVEQLQKSFDKVNSKDLSVLRDELDESLRIAARTEERMREIEGKYDENEFLKE